MSRDLFIYQKAVFSKEEIQFLDQLALLMLENNNAQALALSNVAAITQDGRVHMSLATQRLMGKTVFAQQHGIKNALTLIRNLYFHELKRGVALGAIPNNQAIMLTCLSSTPIPAGRHVLTMPGTQMHRDGNAHPYTTSITLTGPRTWKGGSLSLMPYVAEIVNAKPSEAPSHLKKNITVEQGDMIIFNNRSALHAVNPQFNAKAPARRTIFQARLNNHTMPRQLLWAFEPQTPLYCSLPMTRFMVNQMLRPQPKNFGTAPLSALSAPLKKLYDVPLRSALQTALIKQLGVVYKTHLQQLQRDGLLILPGYFAKHASAAQTFYRHLFRGRSLDPFLAQASINGAVNREAAIMPAVLPLFADPALIALFTGYFSMPVRLANWRAYELGERPPIDYRAWGGCHNDQKGREIKIMILINGVNKGGKPCALGRAPTYLIGCSYHNEIPNAQWKRPIKNLVLPVGSSPVMVQK